MAAVTVHKGVAWKSLLLIILLIAGLSLLAAIPLSFFLNGNLGDWFGNMPLDLLPPPNEPPNIQPGGQWEIPDFDQLPEGWENWTLPEDFTLPDGFNGSLPPGEIPWWLPGAAVAGLLLNGSLPGGGDVPGGGTGGIPGMGGSMGGGLGPFGTGSTMVYVSVPQPWRYWRIGVYDYYEGSTWLKTDNTTVSYPTDDSAGTDYNVIIQVDFSQAGYGTLPLPHLWNRPMIRSGLSVIPSTNVTWNLIEDSYGVVYWNASIEIPGTYVISYTVTYDSSVSIDGIEANVYAQSPLNFVADPGDGKNYLQIPDLSAYPAVVADMQAVASNPAIATNNTYETAKALMEYFKTRWWWTPFRDLPTGHEFDPGFLLNNGYGISSDFASNYVMYLRYLNISSRLVWGGIGHQDASDIPSYRKLTHSHFWAEVWIPNATNTGGEWVQFDPTPFPPTMWQPDQSASDPKPLIPVNTRRNDTRVETSHYTMFLNASVPPNTPQNRGIDLFNLSGTLVRDGYPITRTWLNETVTYTYADVTANKALGTFLGSFNNYNFSTSDTAGPHRFNASFHAVQNETVVTCNGTTIVTIQSLNPHTMHRGPAYEFIVNANISDASNGNPIKDVELKGRLIEMGLDLSDNYGLQLTNQLGEVISGYSIPTNAAEGLYNFTMRFNGTFTVNYPDPFPDYYITVPGSGSQSQNETIIVVATLNLTMSNPSSSILPRAHTITFSGILMYDNGTGIPGQLVTVWWMNSTGTYNLSTDITDGAGQYQVPYFIPESYNDLTGNNDVRVWANFSVVWGNATTDPNALFHVRCSNQTNLVLNTNLPSIPYAIRTSTQIHVWGSLWDPLGFASTAGQVIELRASSTTITPITLDGAGSFDTYITIPDTQPLGLHNLTAVFSGLWIFGTEITSVPSSASTSPVNSSHEVTVVASTVLTKSQNTADIGRVVSPTPMIAGDPVYVAGYLLFDNGTGFGSQTVEAWWITQDGTEISMGSDTTDSTGFYNITYLIPLYQPTDVIIKTNYSAGALQTSYILNASTTQDPSLVWAVNISINSVTPSEALRGHTAVTVAGRLMEKHGELIPNELIYITFDGQNIRDQSGLFVTATTDSQGYFSTTFIPSINTPINAAYVVNATLTNSSFIFNQAITQTIEINTTTNLLNMAIDRTAFLNETFTISGRLVDNLDQDLTGAVTFLVDGNPVLTQLVTGSFSWVIVIPDNVSLIGNHLMKLEHNGTIVTAPSSIQMWWNIPGGADLTITTIAGVTPIGNVTLNGGTQITVAGNLGDSLSSYGIFNRQVNIYYNNSLVGSGFTDGNGDFQIQITVPAIAGNTTLFAAFTANGTTYYSLTISIQTIIPPGIGDLFLPYLPWIIGLVVGIVGVYAGYSLYKRRGRQIKLGKLSKFEDISIEGFRAKLAALIEGKRHREAIIYSYYTFLNLMQDYFDKPKKPSQTARDYAMKTAVKVAKLPPTLVYPFTSLFELARYGKEAPTENQLKEAIQLFLALHQKIQEIPREKVKEAELVASAA
ncbi:MAG: transglutaminase domain-containing protein [Candidatus Helarchaeota archaeon]